MADLPWDDPEHDVVADLKAAGLAPVVLQYQLPFLDAAMKGEVLQLVHTRKGPVWSARPPLKCPECEAGKCPNCMGDALDPGTDEIVDCECSHLTERQT